MYFKKYILYLLAASFILIGCAPVQYHKSTVKPRGGVYHTVKKGETLWSISQAYRVDVKKIFKANGLSNARLIKVGQRLFIPGAKEVKQVKTRSSTKSTRSLKPKSKKSSKRTSITFIWPVQGKIISTFGSRGQKRHQGIDIKAPSGTPIVAASGGKVIYSGGGLRGYGNVIIIEHNKRFSTVYAHNSLNLVKEGAKVKGGQIIAYVGNTGRATTPHLHFEIRRNNKAENPLIYLHR